MQLVDTLELKGIALSHKQSVLVSFEDFCFIYHVISASYEIALPFD